jgi:hypothetical protein
MNVSDRDDTLHALKRVFGKRRRGRQKKESQASSERKHDHLHYHERVPLVDALKLLAAIPQP